MPRQAADPDDYTGYAGRELTAIQEHYVDWIKEKTGVDPTTFRTKEDAFAAGVRLSWDLRMKFQASDENRAARERGDYRKAEPEPKAPTSAPKVAAKTSAPAPATTKGKPSAGRGRGRPKAPAAAAESF